MIYLLLALQWADIVTTVLALRVPGTREVNPVLNPLFEKFGVLPVMLTVKALYAVLIIGAVPYMSVYSDTMILAVSALYMYVVYNNYQIYKNG